MCTNDTDFLCPLCYPPPPTPHFLVLVGKWLLTSHVFLHNHWTDFVQVVSVLLVPCPLPLMTTRGLSVSMCTGWMWQYLSFTLSLLTGKINFLLLCQSCENYLNRAEIQPGFQKEFVFQHFLSSDHSLLQRAIKQWGRTWRQAPGTDSFDISCGSCPHRILKPLESWLVYSALNVSSTPKQEYFF